LPYTRVTDDGIKHLTKLKKLILLDISGTPVTDGAIPYLASLPNKHTQILYDERTNLTKAGIAKLKKLRPDLVIELLK
jgi:hypothetical protein